jgi:L-histidine N-alpha-methyltransferase
MLRAIDTADTHKVASPFARDVAQGLARTPKAIPSAYFYDDRGSALFQQITELPEYYLTRSEREILETYGPAIAARLPRTPYRLIELGAGDGHKTVALLRHLLAAGHAIEYVPIDICAKSVLDLTAKIQQELVHPRLSVSGLVGDHFDALVRLRVTRPKPSVMLFLGSSIGNYSAGAARKFLRTARQLLRAGDQMLIGFDLKKDPALLIPAYDDSAGVTREFNLNLLDRMNHELDAEFDRAAFAHHATYNLRRGCMESWLVSQVAQRVPIRALQRVVSFARWEGMRVECSHKYNVEDVAALAAASGFNVERNFVDSRGYFLDALWRAAGEV